MISDGLCASTYGCTWYSLIRQIYMYNYLANKMYINICKIDDIAVYGPVIGIIKW